MNAFHRTQSDAAAHHVLVVDDEEIVLAALRETLRREGYTVTVASSPSEALRHMKEHLFSAIISDYQMPERTGLDFLADAKIIQPDATRILITAVLTLDTVIEAINRGEIFRFIVKPWLREELLVTVKNAIQRYELVCRNSLLQATTLAMNEKLVTLNRELEGRLAKIEDQNAQLARLNNALSGNLQRTAQLCVRVLETFYPTLGSQTRRVYALCKAMADGLELTAEERNTLELSAWLHDIGLLGTPRQLIRKWQLEPDTLTPGERTLIEHHPVLGQELAGFAQNLEAVGLVIRSHHERFDGQGYPDRLHDDQIPWLARLLAVAVGYAQCDLEDLQAAEFIRQGSGHAYDPEAVRHLLRSLPHASVPRLQREVLLSELKPGMVVARGIYTSSGLLLIPEGQQLTGPYIDKLLNHNRINPITQSLVVYC